MGTKKKASASGKHGKSAPVQRKRQSRTSVDAVDSFLSSTTEEIPVAVSTPAVESPAVPPTPEDDMSEEEVMSRLIASKARFASLEAQVEEERQTLVRLYKRYQVIRDDLANSLGINTSSMGPPAYDKRSLPNPEKNLKISVRAAYRWAKQAKKSPEAARDGVIDSTIRSAKRRYKDDPTVAPFLREGKLPPIVMKVIDYWYENYDKVKESGWEEPEEATTAAV